jgi:hypothetical protein
MRRYLRFTFVLLIVAFVSTRQAETLPSHEVDRFYYDSNGGLIGEYFRSCNNQVLVWGDVVGYAKMSLQTFPCSSGSSGCNVSCWDDCNCYPSPQDPGWCCAQVGCSGNTCMEAMIGGCTCEP